LSRENVVGAGRRSVALSAILAVVVGATTLLGGCGKQSATSKASSLIQDGIAAAGQGNSAAAIADYQAAVTANPLSSIAYYDLGVAYGEKDEVVQARTAFQKALLINSEYKAAMYDLAVLDTRTEPATAIQLYRQLITTYPDSPDALFNLGLLLDHLGDKAPGAAYIAKAVALDPSLKSRAPKPAKPATSTTKPSEPTTSTTKAP
jgi:tetratricopeptide (TPR) repeat protein